MMLEQIKSVVEKIESAEAELQSIEPILQEKEMKRLTEIVEIAKKGIKFEKIWYSNGNEYSCDAKTYFEDENGKNIKGIRVDVSKEILNIDTGSDYYHELWLINNGKFWILKNENMYDFSTNPRCRKVIKKNVDPTMDVIFIDMKQIDEDIPNVWDIDYITKQITNSLNKRLQALGNRTKTQKERLEKIEKLEIK